MECVDLVCGTWTQVGGLRFSQIWDWHNSDFILEKMKFRILKYDKLKILNVKNDAYASVIVA